MGFQDLLQKKNLMIVCGIGGVGKTTLSAALALKGAKMGKKSLVITVDPSKRLASILQLASPSQNPKRIWKEKGELHACLLEAKLTFDGLIERYASENIKQTILNNPLYQHLSLMLAGTQEYMAMEKLYSLASDEKFDLIVVDTPPAKQAIDFLKAPMRLINLLNDSLLKWFIAPTLRVGTFGSKILGTFSQLAGVGILEDISHLMHLSLSLLDGFTKRADAIQGLLHGKQTAFILALAPQTHMIAKGMAFLQELSDLGHPLEGILVNRMPPSFGNKEEVAKALEWARKQKTPAWRQAGVWLKQNQALLELMMTRIKPILNDIPHYGLIPEVPEGVSNLEDLIKLSEYV